MLGISYHALQSQSFPSSSMSACHPRACSHKRKLRKEKEESKEETHLTPPPPRLCIMYSFAAWFWEVQCVYSTLFVQTALLANVHCNKMLWVQGLWLLLHHHYWALPETSLGYLAIAPVMEILRLWLYTPHAPAVIDGIDARVGQPRELAMGVQLS